MKQKTLYTCEICHTDFKEKQKALECEKHHSKKLEIVDKRYVPKNGACDGNHLPVSITVKDENGNIAVYKR